MPPRLAEPPAPEPWPLSFVAASAARANHGPPHLRLLPPAPAATPPPDVATLVTLQGSICHAPLQPTLPPPRLAIHCQTRGHEETRREVSGRAHSLESAPPLPLRLPPAASSHQRRGQKGTGHSAAHGPWACSLDLMPPAPVTGARRAAAGLAAVTMTRTAERAILRERSARALVSVLPLEAAVWMLKSSRGRILSTPPAFVAEQLVAILKAHNHGSLDSAYSALGRLLSWVPAHTGSLSIDGLDVAAWAAATSPSESTWAGLAWVRDHCGLVTHARASSSSRFRHAPPASEHDKEAITPFIVAGLDWLAANHPSPYVRGQAAGWALASRSALRIEQASSCVINAVVPLTGDGPTADIVFGSVILDKNPDPAKMTARPFLGVASSPAHGRASLDALRAMLDGREDVQSILIDTDSPSGNPLHATTWLRTPLSPGTRANSSLQGLHQLPPISLSPEAAAAFKGHSSKRHLLRLAEASPRFSVLDCNEIGRFCGSVSQSPDLIPTAALLQRHTARCAVLPAIYAGPDKLQTVALLLVRTHEVASATLADVLSDGHLDSASAFIRARGLEQPPPPLLLGMQPPTTAVQPLALPAPL